VDGAKDLWGAIGELRRTRRELVSQLAIVAKEAVPGAECSFCGESPPSVMIVPGPEASICDRCVSLCAEILEIARSPE
jgi:hypothetical protein